MSDQADQSATLAELYALQRRTFAALVRTVDVGLAASDEALERYLPLARKLMAGVVGYETRWPGSFDLEGYAQPLVQGLTRYADHREAAGDRESADSLRAEADRLAHQFLGAAANAAVVRERAMGHAAAGRFHEALMGLDAAHGAFVAEGDRTQAAQTLVQRANVYEWLCDYPRALALLEQAQASLAEDLEGGPPSTTRVALSLGRQMLGIVRGKSGTEGMDALALRRAYFEIVQGRARLHRHLGNYEQARRLFEEARPFVQFFVRSGVDFHLAAIALAQNSLDEAEALLSAIEPEFEKRLLRPRLAALRQLQADLMLARKRPEEALARAEDGLSDQKTYPDLDLAWKLHWRRARALSALGRSDAALKAYEAAAQAADALRRAPLGYALDSSFVRDKLPMFEAAIDEAVAQRDAQMAIQFIELVKARALSAVLSVPRLAGGDDDAARFDAMSLELDALAFKFFSGSAVAADVHERDRLQTERTELLERIRIHDPRWRAMTEPPPVDAASLHEIAGPPRNVLVLYRRGRRITSALLGADGLRVGELVCTEGTETALHEYVENLHKTSPDWFLSDLSGELQVGVADLVPEDIACAAIQADTLLVVPHGALHLLPWAAMTLDGRRLFEHAAVGVLPNLSALALLDGALTPPRSVALLGDPDYTGLTDYGDLPEAGPEIDDVARTYGTGHLVVPPLTRAQATEQALFALLARPDAADSILHVACHGDVKADEPLTSGLILTGSKADAAEILQRPCTFPEVVLSACSTGWRPQSAHGIELAGDDALGLTASFLEAGARSLLVSIPQAKDSTARTFTVNWHRHRRAGATPLQAYRQVQLELYAADPATVWQWAGITAYGCR